MSGEIDSVDCTVVLSGISKDSESQIEVGRIPIGSSP